MKITLSEKLGAGKFKLLEEMDDKQKLHEKEEQEAEHIATVCRRPAFGWSGKCKVAAVLAVVVLILCHLSFFLYSIKFGEDFHFPTVTRFVHRDDNGKILRGRFSWKFCGSNKDPGELISLKVLPDPVDLTKNIKVSMSAILDTNVPGPIEVSMKVQKKAIFLWIKLPCAYGVGSCTYQDVCKMTPFPGPAPCPEPFPKLKIPCRCPLDKGLYEMRNGVLDPRAVANEIPSWLASGYYYIKAQGYFSGKRLGCMEMYVSVD